MKIFLITSTLNSSHLFENRFENVFVDHNKSTFLFCYKDKFNIRVKKSVNFSNSDFTFVFQNLVERVSIRIIIFFRDNCKITFNYLVNQRSFQTSAMFSIFSLSSNFDFFNSSQDIDLFNSSLSCFDSKIRQFNDVTSFLRNLEHCQELYRYRRTKLLEYMLWTLNDFVWKWYKKQTHFNFLSRFDMILTKAFLSQKQRELKTIAQKRAKRKIRKIAERAELKIIKTAKQTSTFQNIDIFDSKTCDESRFDLYNEIANFLQHFQQCQHRYRKSDLLNLLFKCLCDFVFEWFKTQFEFISLKRFDKILAKTFSKASVRRVSKNSNFQLNTLDVISESIEILSDFEITNVRIVCKLCKQSFNFNEKLYEHIRKHEVLKLVENSHLSINAVNLVCEIEKRSFVWQKSHESFTKSQNSIFESAVAFETVTLLKRSSFSFFTLETISKSIENTSMQCLSVSSVSSSRIMTFSEISIFCSFLTSSTLETKSESTKKSATCRHCKQTFSFKKIFRQHKRKQHAKKFVVNSHFSIDAVKSTCESIKISTINFTLFLLASLDIFNSIRFHQNLERRRFNQIIIFIQHFQQCQHLYCESELLEWVKIVFCDFVDIWFENQSNFIFLHDFNIILTKTFFATSKTLISNTKTILQIDSSKRSSFLFFTHAIAFELTKKTTTCRHYDEIFNFKKSLREHKSEQHSKKHVKNFRLENNAVKLLCAIEKKSTIISTAEVSEFTSKQNVEWRSRTVYLFTRLKTSRLNFSLNTFVTISERMKNASIQKVTCAHAICRFCDQNFNFNEKFFEHIREHEALKRINKIKSTCETTSKSAIACLSHSQKSSNSTKNTSVQRICRQCKQSFHFNNKFHEHIRQHHARKSIKSFDFRVFTQEFTCKIKEKSAIECSSILFATSRSQIFSTKIVSQSLLSKCSNLSIATYKISSKSMKSAAVVCSLIFSSISSFDSVRKHQEFHIQKFYLIVNDLSRMFVEKSKSFDLQQHQNRCRFSQDFVFRQFDRSCLTFSKKFYLTIEKLFEMFDEKFNRMSLFQSQNNVFSRKFFSKQSQITIYFKFTVNQKSSIDQISKDSKSKISKQHMFAKSIRIVFSKILFEKSIKSLYKLFHVFDEISFFIFILFRFLSIFLFVFAFVSTVFAARMSCISVYQQVISIIDRVNIEFIVSRRNWEETRDKLLEYSVTKHQKFEFSTLYTQNHVQNQEEVSNRLLVCFVNFSFCNIYIDIWINIIEMFASLYCDTQYHIKINEKIISFIFSNIRIKTSKILSHYSWFDSHVSWKV